MLVRSSPLAVHGVLPPDLSLYTKRHETMVTARMSLTDDWMDSFVSSAAELERKTPSPYLLGSSKLRGILRQDHAKTKFSFI